MDGNNHSRFYAPQVWGDGSGPDNEKVKPSGVPSGLTAALHAVAAPTTNFRDVIAARLRQRGVPVSSERADLTRSQRKVVDGLLVNDPSVEVYELSDGAHVILPRRNGH